MLAHTIGRDIFDGQCPSSNTSAPPPPVPRQYPRLMTLGAVSHDGPTREQMAETSFSMTFVASGWKEKVARDQPRTNKPDQTIVARVGGPMG